MRLSCMPLEMCVCACLGDCLAAVCEWVCVRACVGVCLLHLCVSESSCVRVCVRVRLHVRVRVRRCAPARGAVRVHLPCRVCVCVAASLVVCGFMCV